MTSPSNGQLAVDQTYYIAALEDDLARETKARRVLSALVNQHRATIAAYLERYGDITDQPAEPADRPATSPAGEESDRA